MQKAHTRTQKRTITDPFETYHFVATANENGNSSRVGAFFDDQHVIFRRAEWQFSNNASMSEFVVWQLLEPRDDATACCNSNELQGPETREQVKSMKHTQETFQTAKIATQGMGTNLYMP